MHQNGAMSDFEGGVRLTSSEERDQFELFGSLFCSHWRESEAQLTEKQAVLLMHDIYSVMVVVGVVVNSLYIFILKNR